MKTQSILLISLFGFILLYGCKEKNIKSSTGELTYSSRLIDLSSLGPGFIESMNEKIFTAVKEGKIKAYSTDSLLEGSLLSIEEVQKIGGQDETIELAPDPENPNYLIDTVIHNPFFLKDAVGHQITDIWSFARGSNTYSATPYAIAITYNPIIAGVEIGEMPLFWIAFDEINDLVGSENFEQINDLIFKQTIHKLSVFE
jgi:hypothetical protein